MISSAPAVRRYGAVIRLNAQLAFVGRGWIGVRTAGALVAMATPYYVWRSVFAGTAQVGSTTNPVSIVVDTLLISGNGIANALSLS